MNRPLTSHEQSLADTYRQLLNPLAEAIERESTVSACAARRLLDRPAIARARRERRESASRELWQHALRHQPQQLGVIELVILKLVINVLVNWIMRHWMDRDGD